MRRDFSSASRRSRSSRREAHLLFRDICREKGCWSPHSNANNIPSSTSVRPLTLSSFKRSREATMSCSVALIVLISTSISFRRTSASATVAKASSLLDSRARCRASASELFDCSQRQTLNAQPRRTRNNAGSKLGKMRSAHLQTVHFSLKFPGHIRVVLNSLL